jgi:vancomycin resistance protein YoaR
MTWLTVLYKFFLLTLLIMLSACGSISDKTALAGEITVIAAEAPGESMDTGTSRYINPRATVNARELGSFDTGFNPKLKNRSHNIVRASDAINNQIIQPGELFSYNETVGPTSKKNGFKKGTIFIKGEKYEGYGGGVCQVSSTLYNAAVNAGMTIVERHDHSMPVDYVEQGNDAATSYGGIDFKFINEKPFPVVINSFVNDGTVSISINAV